MSKKDNCDLPSQSPPKDTPVGGDSKLVIVGNDLKIGFDRERDTTENLWSRLGLPLPDDGQRIVAVSQEKPVSIFKEKRANRGRQGISKGNILAIKGSGLYYMYLVDQEKQDVIHEAVAKLSLSEEQSERFAFHTIFFMAEMIASKSFDRAIGEAKTFKTFLDNTHELIGSLRTISANPALGPSFDIAVRNKIQELLRKSEIRALWEAKEENARDLKYLLHFGSIAEIIEYALSAILAPVAELQVRLESGKTIKNSSEYKFVFEVARAWWICTNRIPTVSRAYSSGETRKARQPSFQQFIEAIAPEIGSDTIRTTLAAFKVAMGSGADKKSPD